MFDGRTRLVTNLGGVDSVPVALNNVRRFGAGEPLVGTVDLELGY